MSRSNVLIAGAGPTGLVLALWLTKAGVKVRIIDKAAGPGTTSRALVIHARNLEFYHQLGIAAMAVEKGVEITAANLWSGGRRTGHVPFSNLRADISPYQYMLALPQDEQEQMLEQELQKLGVTVERNTDLLSFSQAPSSVTAQLRTPNGVQQYEAAFLAGCDGAHSIVREQLKAGFPGGTYEEVFYVADLVAKGLFIPGEVNIALDQADFLAIFPLRRSGDIRLVGTIRQGAMAKENLQWEDVSKGILQRLKFEVQKVNWFSTYKVHHRVADHFRVGNVFLLGDAGHIHSPIGAQGMNTGIGDAVNLAWKLDAVINHEAPLSILDTYEDERIRFANQLVATTDKAFTFVSARSKLASLIRVRIVPYLLPRLFGITAIRRFLFRTISQILINYRHSKLSVGKAGRLSAGDRLPWVRFTNAAGGYTDNFASLTSMSWQIHCYGTLPEHLKQLFDERQIPVHIFPWIKAVRKKGLAKNAVYIIRPDGHIGLAASPGDTQAVAHYINLWHIHGR